MRPSRLLILCSLTSLLSGCNPTHFPEEFEQPVVYKLSRVEKVLPEVLTRDGKVTGYKGRLSRLAPFSLDTITTFRQISRLTRTMGRIYRRSPGASSSIYALHLVTDKLEMTPKTAPTYFQLAPGSESGFREVTNAGESLAASTIRATYAPNEIRFTQYALAYKFGNLTAVKVDQNQFDPQVQAQLLPGDTLVVLTYQLTFRRN